MTRNTLLYNLVFIVLGTVLAVAVAIILNEVPQQKSQAAVSDRDFDSLSDLHGHRQLSGVCVPEQQQRLYQ